MAKKTEAKAPSEKRKMPSITPGELDRALAAFLGVINQSPGSYTKGVFAALKSFEKDRRLREPKGAR